MKTEDLIALLAADAETRRWPLHRSRLVALAFAMIGGVLLLFLVLGLREDLAAASAGVRFPLKVATAVALAFGGFSLLTAAAEPRGIETHDFVRLAPAGILLFCGIVFELVVSPPSDWMALAIGQNALVCLFFAPLLSLPALAAAFMLLGRGAPTNLPMAGVAAGLFAAGVGTGAYALHCPDDSPLFVAIWYVIATALVTVPSSVVARRALRW